MKDSPPPFGGKKILLAKSDLHAMEQILYAMGLRVVSRWIKNKFALKYFLGNFEWFKSILFLVEN